MTKFILFFTFSLLTVNLIAQGQLFVETGSSGATPNSKSIGVLESNDRGYLNILTPTNTEKGILFGEPGNSEAGGIIYNGNVLNGLEFRTHLNATKMAIGATGNVGIGTTAPEKQLHLKGDGFIKLEDTGTPEGDFAELNVTPGGVFRLYKHSTNENGGINILSSGYVGIGANTPERALHIQGDGLFSDDLFIEANTEEFEPATILVRSRGTANAKTSVLANDRLGFLAFRGHDGTTYRQASSIGGYAETNFNSSINGDLRFFTVKNNTSIERLRINSDGNLGIGTGSPTRRLHVRAGTNTSIPMRVESQDLTSATIDFKDPTTTADWQARIGGKGDGLVFIAGGEEIMDIRDNGFVGIGTFNPIAKLEVSADDASTALRAKNSMTQNNGNAFGLYALSEGLGTDDRIGVYGTANGGTGTKYGIYGYVPPALPGTHYAGYFAGNLAYTGSFINASDRKFKKNIKGFKSLEKVMQLKPKMYNLKVEEFKQMGFSNKTQYGFIAQELQEVFPNLVSENTNIVEDNEHSNSGEKITTKEQYLGVHYVELIPILTKAIQEQQAIIEEQQSENQTLKSELANIKSNYKNLEIELQQLKDLVYQISDKFSNHRENTGNSQQILELNAISHLNQNIPNPFDQTTIIDYFIPKTAQSAQLQITNLRGQVIQTRTLNVGKGQVTLHQKDLADGTYAYSLIIDGKVIDTKQMILTK